MMNIQIFGKSKCFGTKKAERYFKERRIRVQSIDILKYGMSRGEFDSVRRCVGLNAMIDPKVRDAEILKYLAYETEKAEKLFENQQWITTPIVRSGKLASVGYCPDVWENWK